MKKSDLVKVARKGLPYPSKIVDLILKAINTALINKEKVTIYNFGEFYVIKTGVKKIYDFKTRKIGKFAGRYKIKFRPSPFIEKILNKKESDS